MNRKPERLHPARLNPLFPLAAIAASAALSLTPSAHAQHDYIANGGFETADPEGPALFEAWTNNDGVTLAEQAIEGESSARIAFSGADTGNALVPIPADLYDNLTTFTVSFDFAASDPNGPGARSLQLNLRTIPGQEGGNINMRVVNGSESGMGSIEVYDGGWNLVLENAVTFSTSESGDGFIVHSATITGDYTGDTPVYTIGIDDALSSELSFFQNSAPAPGTPLAEVSFQSGQISAFGWAVVDNVALDGPTPPEGEPDPDPDPEPEPRDDYLVNGDFEMPGSGISLYEFWTNNAGVTEAAETISGDHSPRIAASTANAGNALNHDLYDPLGILSTYTLSFQFAASNPGSATDRSLQLNLRTVPNAQGGNINMRVVSGTDLGKGTLQVFQDGWHDAVANAVDFSTDETGSGLNLNTLMIVGDYSGEAPVYTITINDVVSETLAFFQNSPPAQGDALAQISFQSGSLAAEAWAVVDDLTFVGPPAPEQLTFDQWREAKFTAEELSDPAISGPEADPAGDGIPNLLKFALGLEPKVSSRANLPAADLTSGDLLLTYTTDPAAGGVELGVEISNDLVEWHSGETVTEVVATEDLDGLQLITVKVLPPFADASRAFIQVRATQTD